LRAITHWTRKTGKRKRRVGERPEAEGRDTPFFPRLIDARGLPHKTVEKTATPSRLKDSRRRRREKEEGGRRRRTTTTRRRKLKWPCTCPLILAPLRKWVEGNEGARERREGEEA
jgi:hypothetical protein